MAVTNDDLLFLVHQHLKEKGLIDAAHALESGSGLFFDSKHFLEALVAAGRWDDAEKYLGGFTSWENNGSSLKMFFELRKQKYLEALDKRDHAAAIHILKTDLRIFQGLNMDIYQELTSLLALDDFRQNEKLAVYGNTANARALMIQELRNLIEHNPALRDKMSLPPMPPAALVTIFTQLATVQQQAIAAAAVAAAPAALAQGNGRLPDPAFGGARFAGHAAAVKPEHGHRPSQVQAAAARRPAAVRPATSPLLDVAAAGAPTDRASPTGRKRPLSQDIAAGTPGSDAPAAKRSLPEIPVRHVGKELPSKVACVINLPSPATTCDFHPTLHSLLLVGTVSGHALLWSLGSKQCLLDLPCDSTLLRNAAITRVVWSPDGLVFGVAFHACKGHGVIHLYSWSPKDGSVGSRSEIDAHEGGVNDLALTHLDTRLIAVSGGTDAQVKVWDAATSELLFRFTGHDGPVYSVCPHVKGNICFVFSTGRDGRIKAWLYDSQVAAVVDYSAEGIWWTHMAYSADGNRLFSCGVGGQGADSTLVEWNESDGAISRQYRGFRNSNHNLTRFDTVANRYLIVGDEGAIKVWHMDRPDEMMLLPLEAEVPPSAVVRVNSAANLIALSTNGSALNILADAAGHELLAVPLPKPLTASRAPSEKPAEQDATKQPGAPSAPDAAAAKEADSEKTTSAGDAPSGPQESLAVLADCSVTELPAGGAHSSEAVECLLLAPTDELLLAATATGFHHIWNQEDGSWKYKGTHGRQVEKELPAVQPRAALALSKNQSYLLGACGGRVTLYNLVTSKEITSFQEKPPGATALAFDPLDNNLLVLGLNDGTCAVQNVRQDRLEWASKKAHKAAVTGLAFLAGGGVLVTVGADAQLAFWTPSSEEPHSYAVEGKVRLRAAAVDSTPLTPPSDGTPMALAPHPTAASVLVVHPQQLALYVRAGAARLAAWSPQPGTAFGQQHVAAAAFASSGSGLHVCAAFDGTADIGVFDAAMLTPVARIASPSLAASLAGGMLTALAMPHGAGSAADGLRILAATTAGKVLSLQTGDSRLRSLVSSAAEQMPNGGNTADSSGGGMVEAVSGEVPGASGKSA